MLAVAVVRLVYYKPAPASFDIRAFGRGNVRLLNAQFESSMRIAALRALSSRMMRNDG